jgi:hypothetical protein
MPTAIQAFEWYLNGLATYTELTEIFEAETHIKCLKTWEQCNAYLNTWYLGYDWCGISFQTFIYWMYN